MTRAPAARARQRGFFDFSMAELAIIFGLALVVLGPKKLPGLVQQIGRWVGRARHMARQFREQLESEVNSINAVKPVPYTPPTVGPAAPGTEAAPNLHAAAAGTEAVAPEAAPEGPAAEAPPAATAPAGSDVHPEAQMYFAMNGSEPAVVGQDPYAPQPVVEPPLVGEHPEQGEPAAAAAEESSQPASVPVIFPHDHG
jgi:sec-independent protein translocase protein TatB